MRMPPTFRAPLRSPFLQVAKSAVATVSAWVLAGWLIQGPAPVFAAIAALLVVQPSVNQSLTRAVERSVGVVAGVVIASTLGLLLGSHTLVILLASVVALIAAWALKMTPGTANQVAISALLVLAMGTATPGYALDRVLETLIGAAIGLVVNLLLVPPLLIEPARERLDALTHEVASSLDRLADALSAPQAPAAMHELLLSARLMRPMRDAAEKALDDAAESLTLNPRSRTHRAELHALRDHLDRFSPIVTQVIGMTRTSQEHYSPTLAEDPAVRAIAEQLHRAAHDTRLVQRELTGMSPRAAEPQTEAALTRPIEVQTPSPEHWIVVGSLLADLRRIHEALADSTAG